MNDVKPAKPLRAAPANGAAETAEPLAAGASTDTETSEAMGTDAAAPPRALVIIGPTAVGKSSFALHIAETLGGEIVSCDSVQTIRGFDIGSAKPSAAEQARVRHHLIDIVDSTEQASAAMASDLAETVIARLQTSGPPVIVGGTGLYLRALLHGLDEMPGKDEEIRSRLRSEWDANSDKLWTRLQAVDAPTAERIHHRDQVRVVRALEVYELTGKPISAWQLGGWQERRRIGFTGFGLTAPRPWIAQRALKRAKDMLNAGLIDEVRALLAAGVPSDAPGMGTIGYRQVSSALQSEAAIDMDILADAIALATRRYAKRQLTWFRKQPGIRWVRADQCDVWRDTATEQVHAWWTGGTAVTVGSSSELAVWS